MTALMVKAGFNRKKNMKKLLELFKRPTPLQMVALGLAEAHLSKLQAEEAVEYAQSVVAYNLAKIERLNKRREEYK
jgi:GMP synthase PP-ATPase subunit